MINEGSSFVSPDPAASWDARYSDLRILTTHESWWGNNALSAFHAFARTGAWVEAVSEGDYLSPGWADPVLRVARKLARARLVRSFNDAVIGAAKRMRPDVFFVVKGTWIEADTLRQLKGAGTACYCVYPDVSFMTHGPYLPAALPSYDWIFTTKSFGVGDLRRELGVRHASYLPNACDPWVHQPRRRSDRAMARFGCQVAFVGSHSPHKVELLEALVRARPAVSLRIWGNGWERLAHRSPLRTHASMEPVTGVAYSEALSCADVALGLLSEVVAGASSGDLITTRTFEIPACGVAMLHERTPDLLELFEEDTTCFCFDGPHELIAQVDRLLSHAELRTRVAAQGLSHVRSHHTWDHRVRTILDEHLRRSRN